MELTEERVREIVREEIAEYRREEVKEIKIKVAKAVEDWPSLPEKEGGLTS